MTEHKATLSARFSRCPRCEHALTLDEVGRVTHGDGEARGCGCLCEGAWADPHRHPHSGDYYEGLPDGLVKVIELRTGRTGIFDSEGVWQSGELRHADWHMLQFAALLLRP